MSSPGRLTTARATRRERGHDRLGRLEDSGAGLAVRAGQSGVQRVPDHCVHGRHREALQYGDEEVERQGAGTE